MTPQEKQIRELSDEAFQQHAITERMRCGLFRSWRCQRPGSWTYGFDVTTTPGYLIITGDLNEMIVSHMADMLPWCRRAVDSIDRGGLLEITRDVWVDDPPLWEEWDDGFLWVRDAIRWFLNNHTEPEITL